ncbi:glycosyltransferase 61 family protein [Synechococcus sp. LTW-G]
MPNLLLLPPEENSFSKHASELLASSPGPDWSVIKRIWKAIGTYPLDRDSISFLRNQALDNRPCDLFLFKTPLVIIYRWPNGELRYFLILNNSYLCESKESAVYLGLFPFIEPLDAGFSVDLDRFSCERIPGRVAWLPINANYSHFLADYVGPWSSHVSHLPLTRSLLVLTPDLLKPWQETMLGYLGMKNFLPCTVPTGAARVFMPDELLVPVAASPLSSLWSLKQYLGTILSSAFSNTVDKDQIVFLVRRDKTAMRIRNGPELDQLVIDRGGHLVDPTHLDYSQKANLLSRAKIIIGDGSSNINASLFMSSASNYIGLLDPLAAFDPRFLSGGWSYGSLISDRSYNVLGTDPEVLPGSPLCSAIYDLDQISQLIDKLQDFP